jgi:hypothetical protein
VFAWFFLAPTFKFIGEYFATLYKNAKRQMENDNENEKEKNDK